MMSIIKREVQHIHNLSLANKKTSPLNGETTWSQKGTDSHYRPLTYPCWCSMEL